MFAGSYRFHGSSNPTSVGLRNRDSDISVYEEFVINSVNSSLTPLKSLIWDKEVWSGAP